MLFLYAYYSDNDASAIGFLEMSVHFGVNDVTSAAGSASGLPGCEFPGITLRVDHSCSDKDVPFPESLHDPGGL